MTHSYKESRKTDRKNTSRLFDHNHQFEASCPIIKTNFKLMNTLKPNTVKALILAAFLLVSAQHAYSQTIVFFEDFSGTSTMQLHSEYQADVSIINNQLFFTGGTDFLWTGNGDSTSYEQAFTDNFYHRSSASKTLNVSNFNKLELQIKLKQQANASLKNSWLRILANGYEQVNQNGTLASNPISFTNDEFYYLSFNLDEFAGGNLVLSLQASCKIENDDAVYIDEIRLLGSSINQDYFSPYSINFQNIELSAGWYNEFNNNSYPFYRSFLTTFNSSAWFSENYPGDGILSNNYLASPVFNLSNQSNTELTITYRGSMPAFLLGSTNQGEDWTDTLHSFIPATGWELIEIDLMNFDGSESLRLAVHTKDTIDQASIFAFNEFMLSSTNNSLADLAIIGVVSPVNQAFYSNNEVLSVSIHNNGMQSIQHFEMAYKINGGLEIVEILDTLMNPGDTMLFTFNQVIDLTQVGNYNFEVSCLVPYDLNTGNDSLAFSITVTNPVITSYPYIESFEGNHYWASGGFASSWECGIPNATIINQASNGIKAWVTNLNGPYNSQEKSRIISPVFDFSNLQSPQLSFDIFYSTYQFEDGLNMQYSLDEGTTWIALGSAGDSNYWYNASFVAGLLNSGSLHGWSGNIYSNYVTAEKDLSFLAGESSVRFRFFFGVTFNFNNDEGCAIDHFIIKEEQAYDLGIVSLDFPTGNCILTEEEAIIVQLKNLGTNPISTFVMSYTLDGLNYVTETVNQLLLPGDEYSFTFSSFINLTFPGNYILTVNAYLTNDTYTYNNSLTTEFMLESGLSIPYFQDFEGDLIHWIFLKEPGANGWLVTDDYSSEGFNIPPHTIYAASNDDTCYCNSAKDLIISPHFDLSNNTNFVLEFDAFYTGLYGSDADVLISLDCGYSWQLVYDVPIHATAWQHYEVDLSVFAGEKSVRIAFRHKDNGQWASGFAIDNVHFYGEEQMFEHPIPLKQGWGLYSTYLFPQDSLLNNLMIDVITNVQLVKDGNGDVYWPQFNFNSIGSWRSGRGYQILSSQLDTLIITGSLINPIELEITLPVGWSMIAYLRTQTMNTNTALSSIINDLYLVKEEDGFVFWPIYNLDAIGSMKPGKAYQILMNNPAILIYPPN